MSFCCFSLCNLTDKMVRMRFRRLVLGWRVCTWVPVFLRGTSRQADSVTDTENRLCSGDCVSHFLTHFQSAMSFRWRSCQGFFWEEGWTFKCFRIYVWGGHVWSMCTCAGVVCTPWQIIIFVQYWDHIMKLWWDDCLLSFHDLGWLNYSHHIYHHPCKRAFILTCFLISNIIFQTFFFCHCQCKKIPI